MIVKKTQSGINNVPAKMVIDGDVGYIIIDINDIVRLIDSRVSKVSKGAKHSVRVVDNFIVVEVSKT